MGKKKNDIEELEVLQNERKKKNINWFKLIIILSVLDVLFLLLLIIFVIATIKEMIWICLVLFVLISIALIIVIYDKIKNDKLEERRRRLEEKEEERKRKEEERLKEMKRKMIENQKKLRMKKDIKNETETDINQKINETLENMCLYGIIMKKLIQEEKRKYPENL